MQDRIEGISPSMLWTFCVVLVGLCALFIMGYKVYEICKKIKQSKQLNGQDITDRIADKVIEKLTPQIDAKFADINRKLSDDKELLTMHTTQLNAQKDRVDRLDNDTRALLHGVSALLNHIATGNNVDKIKKTNATMNNYLIDRKYNEEDWKV